MSMHNLMSLDLHFLQGLALVMHKNNEGQSVFEMLNKALNIAQDEKKVPEQRNIGILIAQMHVVKVTSLATYKLYLYVPCFNLLHFV